MNFKSVGVCLIGRTEFTKNQFDSLEKLLKHWIIKYPNAEIKGHRNAINTKKTCPNFDVDIWCKERGFNE